MLFHTQNGLKVVYPGQIKAPNIRHSWYSSQIQLHVYKKGRFGFSQFICQQLYFFMLFYCQSVTMIIIIMFNVHTEQICGFTFQFLMLSFPWWSLSSAYFNKKYALWHILLEECTNDLLHAFWLPFLNIGTFYATAYDRNICKLIIK